MVALAYPLDGYPQGSWSSQPIATVSGSNEPVTGISAGLPILSNSTINNKGHASKGGSPDEVNCILADQEADAQEYLNSCNGNTPVPRQSLKDVQALVAKSNADFQSSVIHKANLQVFQNIFTAMPYTSSQDELKKLHFILNYNTSDLEKMRAVCNFYQIKKESTMCSDASYFKVVKSSMQKFDAKNKNGHFLAVDTNTVASHMMNAMAEFRSECSSPYTTHKMQQARALFLQDNTIAPYFLSDAFIPDQNHMQNNIIDILGNDDHTFIKGDTRNYKGLRAETCDAAANQIQDIVCAPRDEEVIEDGHSTGISKKTGNLSCDSANLVKKIDKAKADFHDTAIRELKIAGLNTAPDFGGCDQALSVSDVNPIALAYKKLGCGGNNVSGYGSNAEGMAICGLNPATKFRQYALNYQFHQYPGIYRNLRQGMSPGETAVLDQTICRAKACDKKIGRVNDFQFNTAKIAATIAGAIPIPGMAALGALAYTGVSELQNVKKYMKASDEIRTRTFGAMVGSYKNYVQAEKDIANFKADQSQIVVNGVVTAVTAFIGYKILDGIADQAAEMAAERAAEAVAKLGKNVVNASTTVLKGGNAIKATESLESDIIAVVQKLTKNPVTKHMREIIKSDLHGFTDDLIAHNTLAVNESNIADLYSNLVSNVIKKCMEKAGSKI